MSTTAPYPLSCPLCYGQLDHAKLLSGRQFCARCGGEFEATRFDPPQRFVTPKSLAEAGPEGATACANHSGNVASRDCERCGVFMCELCRTDSDGMVLCPACFDRLYEEGGLQSTRNRFRDHGRMGITYLLVGFLFWPLGFIFGTGAVVAGIQALRQRARTGDGSATQAWVAIVLGAVVALGSFFLIYFVWFSNMGRPR